MVDRTPEIFPLRNVPHGRLWVWMSPELLVVEATLNEAERRAAVTEALEDFRCRTLGGLLGPPAATAA